MPEVKYGTRASSGGGRASARETIGRVAAGAVAEKWLGREARPFEQAGNQGRGEGAGAVVWRAGWGIQVSWSDQCVARLQAVIYV